MKNHLAITYVKPKLEKDISAKKNCIYHNKFRFAYYSLDYLQMLH